MNHLKNGYWCDNDYSGPDNGNNEYNYSLHSRNDLLKNDNCNYDRVDNKNNCVSTVLDIGHDE